MFPRNAQLKLEIPGLEKLAHDAAYRDGAKDAGSVAGVAGFVLGMCLAFALGARFGKKE